MEFCHYYSVHCLLNTIFLCFSCSHCIRWMIHSWILCWVLSCKSELKGDSCLICEMLFFSRTSPFENEKWGFSIVFLWCKLLFFSSKTHQFQIHQSFCYSSVYLTILIINDLHYWGFHWQILMDHCWYHSIQLNVFFIKQSKNWLENPIFPWNEIPFWKMIFFHFTFSLRLSRQMSAVEYRNDSKSLIYASRTTEATTTSNTIPVAVFLQNIHTIDNRIAEIKYIDP